LEPVETEDILGGAGTFSEGVDWAFMAQWPLKMPKVRESLGLGVLQILDFRFHSASL